MAGNSDKKLQTADVILDGIRTAAEGETNVTKLEQLANAFALVSGAQGGREKGKGSVIL